MIFTNTTKIPKVAEFSHDLKPGADAARTHWDTGFYVPSLIYPYRGFKKAGINVTFASPQGGEVFVDPWSAELWDQPICTNTLEDENVKAMLEDTIPLEELEAEDYDVIFFVGGEGMMFDCHDNETLHSITKTIYENGGVVAGNTNGIVAMLNVKLSNGDHLIKGKNMTAYPPIENQRLECYNDLPIRVPEELVKRGATFKEGIPVKDHVQSHERICTGQNPNSAEPLTRAVVNLTKLSIAAREAREAEE